MESNLINRSQKVFNGIYSDSMSVDHGAPYGSCLGPIRLLIYFLSTLVIVRQAFSKIAYYPLKLFKKIKHPSNM